jgi:SAM-dependent methyltransferase
METDRKPGNARFAEDIPQLAAAASELACRLCGTCQNYHFLWPYLRLAGAPGGAGDGKPYLEAVLADLIAGGRREILIAGTADTGLLSLVARATIGHAVGITVLDRCGTPLELCRRFASRWSLAIETLQVDLSQFSAEGSFDIVFAHTILTFIAPGERLDVMMRLRRSLRPGGRLILRFRTRGEVEGRHLSSYRGNVPMHLIERLDRLKIPLPEPREALQRRIEAYAGERHSREALETDYSEMEKLIDAAGFTIEAITPVKSDHAPAFAPATADVSSRLFVALAVPR